MTPTSLETFFALNPVFTIEEADRFLSARQHGDAANRATRQALLRYYVKQGRLRHIRRGLYTVTRPSFDTGVGGVGPGDIRPGGTEIRVWRQDAGGLSGRPTPGAVHDRHVQTHEPVPGHR